MSDPGWQGTIGRLITAHGAFPGRNAPGGNAAETPIFHQLAAGERTGQSQLSAADTPIFHALSTGRRSSGRHAAATVTKLAAVRAGSPHELGQDPPTVPIPRQAQRQPADQPGPPAPSGGRHHGGRHHRPDPILRLLQHDS